MKYCMEKINLSVVLLYIVTVLTKLNTIYLYILSNLFTITKTVKLTET